MYKRGTVRHILEGLISVEKKYRMLLVNVVMAQMNPVVGDIEGNTGKIIGSVLESQRDYCADMVVFPELTLCGYPPEDLLLRDSMDARINKALNQLSTQVFSAVVVVGYPKRVGVHQYNMVGVLQGGQWIAEYAKQQLPNYQVFDEKRYFKSGSESTVFDFNGVPTALSICEDIWHDAPLLQAKAAGAKLLININASPFHQRKQEERLALVSSRAQQGGMAVVYVNQVGGQDELVFDGGSFVVNADGQCQMQAPLYKEGLFLAQCKIIDVHERGSKDHKTVSFLKGQDILPESTLAVTYQALVVGLRDYVNKNGFKHTILGLSGGIDSALTLAIAVDALGADHVNALMMPFLYTSELSKEDAADQAKRLGVRYDSIAIESAYNAFMLSLSQQFAGFPVDLTEQNLQARCRGVMLMAISNKKGCLVLTTGNKSELAVGYSTLYGDMAGGFDVLKDVPKTMVFELAAYRNSLGEEVIPRSVIERPPSAELAPDQKDEDNLPPYDILDQILERYIEQDESADVIVQAGFDKETVYRVIRLVDINEYKRRQSPIGVRISKKGFGRDRRYPITNGWKLGV
ncbi:MAG: NAD+ synthase (glutamine-hydrolyzing) [Candidatus Endobugula sp.]|jgi:NAD+ synthase (glutamine-hydrolysing)